VNEKEKGRMESRHEGIKRRRKLIHSIATRMIESNQEDRTCFLKFKMLYVSILRASSK
jgi:hypothetical protein